MTDCYVYYRIEPAHEAAAAAALSALLDELSVCDGVRGAVFRKLHEPHLWMEVYKDLSDEALPHRIEALAQKHGLTACLATNERRHIEQFVPLTWR